MGAVVAGKRIADLGCGYHAAFARTVLDEVERGGAGGRGVSDDLKAHPKVDALVGGLPESLAALPDRSIDIVMIVSVLEHLWEPLRGPAARGAGSFGPAACCLVNVPSWRGKRFLEFSAFRLGLSPAPEMDDHKMYYDSAISGRCCASRLPAQRDQGAFPQVRLEHVCRVPPEGLRR